MHSVQKPFCSSCLSWPGLWQHTVAAGEQCLSCSSSHSASTGLCQQLSRISACGRNRLHLHIPCPPPAGRARWTVLGAHGKGGGSQAAADLALPSLSPLCVLAPDRHLIFQQPPFSNPWHRVKKLADSAWFQVQPCPFSCPSTPSSCNQHW